ncbi:TPA: sugar ABC transporter permease [Streptococcus pyogenes]|uniref:Maltodextrin transport system permease protein MalD n=2 Tax=Streptococcus dysgalactiae TaxID=1334 RepID=A0A9X7X8F5_STRDY|nr:MULTISPECIES: sugar ABC transporter permease [Streptococcus]EFY02938.1 maltodextrin transport system permease protein malD [Streptococcus dysgalactiae subsp. dysgalactiae ATCC 27957]EGR88945.1 ABC transporter, permease protein [Streptococcus dysgalactiae subsp. equisimilis SK1250]ERL17690.1 ABC transporter, permease protein [Streptococcus pyogenes GA41046]BAN93818.1 maltodextrin transport system permease [Streptococcus dysgalactiae subsp. equisimilis 167]HER4537123.1 sugar ABC transporter p
MRKTYVSTSMKRKRFFTQLLTYLYLISLAIVILFPILVTVSSAFRPGNTTAFSFHFDGPWTLSNFKTLFQDTLYLRWYWNTLIVAFFTMLIQVTVITLTGYAYSRYNFFGRKKSLIFFLVVQMVPTMAALTAYFVMAWLFNALNQYWFLILIYVGGGIPMNAWLMKGYFDTVPYDLDESAKLDGSGHFRTFYQIVLPLVRPMIAVQSLWAFMGPFGDFMLAKFLLRAQENYTVAVGLQSFITNDARNPKVTLFAAGAILIAVPISVLFFFLQKNFVSGLTSGGTKG